MAGHSKWANIKHRKAAQDKRREKKFTKILKDIQIAAKNGLPDPAANPPLRLAIQNAKGVNIPKDTIDRAIAKAVGAGAETLQYVTYEAYGPFGVGLFIEATTDNINRTVANIRAILSKANGSLTTNGSLSFIFEQQGYFVFGINDSKLTGDEFELEMIDGGAIEIETVDDNYEIYTQLSDFGTMQKKLEQLEIIPSNAELVRIPKVLKKIAPNDGLKIIKLVDKLEEDDDITSVSHNLEITEELEQLLG